MKDNRVLDMTYMSMFLTIILVMAAVPQLGYITIPFLPAGVGATTIHIPVLIACIYFGTKVTNGWKIGGFAGLTFGISSFVVAWMRPVSPLDYVFRNPLVSVLPRILFAILAVVLYRALRKVIKNDIINIYITAILGTVIHTFLVVPLLGAFGVDAVATIFGFEGDSTQIVLQFFKWVVIFNGLLEAVLAGLIVPPIVIALRALKNNNSNDDLTELETIND
ncbi:ECF transporter S component [Haloplasma contractile]|uniref:Membrane protein n=1 Tax=Haloplasma contractile SSD-17B TaxID=1033810 RepID=U2E9N7_9MOLU|nr:ECF transporter S component [Haloplasma contractile]ERJ11546.1 Membrane protein [Haloplasma contractile SSD-17B]